MRFSTFIWSLLAAFLLLSAGMLGHSGVASWEDHDDGTSVSLEDLRAFSEAFALVKRQYVEEVSDETLLRNAMRGMLEKLDPHTTYLDREDMQQWEITTSGEFGGLGIVVTKEEDGDIIKIVSPIDDTPAKRAGLKSGDLIIKLDDETVRDMPLHDAVQVMRGEPGSEIILTIQREDEEELLEVTIVRAIIKVDSVRSRMLEPGYAYLRISNFQVRTEEDFVEHLEDLIDEADGELQGLVLDLRDNPGGLLTSAVSVSSVFLDHEQRIVTTRGRAKSSHAEENADGIDLIGGAPVVVLINGGSASASEIVAGALQDNQRALLLGTRSFGKGSVQTLVPLNQDSALKLTTARYYTPSGRSIHEKGIDPDHLLKYIEPSDEEKERYEETDEPYNDNQILAALEVLKTGAVVTQASTE